MTFGSFPPAAFTRMVGAPSDFSICWLAARRLSRAIASAEKKEASPPACLICLTLVAPLSALRPATATRAPAWANPSAIAPPRTPVAPITTATSPVKSNRFVSFISSDCGPTFDVGEGENAPGCGWWVVGGWRRKPNPAMELSTCNPPPTTRKRKLHASHASRNAVA